MLLKLFLIAVTHGKGHRTQLRSIAFPWVSSGMDVTRDILPLEKYIWGYIKVSTRCIVTKQLWYPRSDFRPITHFVVKLERFLCDRTTPPIIQKLRSKGVTMHVYGVSAFYM